MRKLFAFILAMVSGLYLLFWGPMIGPLDPIRIIDEATALLIFVKSMAALGFDLSRFVPFLGESPNYSRNRPVRWLMFDLSGLADEKSAAILRNKQTS